MAERLRSSRRRVLPAVVILVAVALTGCTGGGIDPAVQFDPIDAPLPDELATELEAVLDQAVLLSGSSGGVAGVWAPWAGEWSAASGTVDFTEGAAPAKTDTEFRMTAVTTEITCTILLRLADAGEVALDDKVVKYVDWIPGLEGITLEQLCRHTSGLADYYPTLRSHFVSNPERNWPTNELLSNGLALSRTGPPGEQVRISRTGIMLLTEALERRTGRSWSELADQYVFDPLGLEDTRIPPPDVMDHPGVFGGYSAGIAQGGLIDCAVVLDDSDQSSSSGGPAAGGVSNLEETARLNEAFATGTLLSEATARAQWTLVPLGGSAPAWQSAAIGAQQYGPMRGAAGESIGALSAAFTDPASGLTVVVALNNSTSGADFVREVAFALASLGSKAAPAEGRELPLVELPWSVDQATAKMLELAKCPPPAEAPAEG